jgi:hypothetical protein
VSFDLTDELRAYLDSLSDEGRARFAEIARQLASGELRRVTLSDGRGVLVDGDCTHTDDEIRAAIRPVQPGNGNGAAR